MDVRSPFQKMRYIPCLNGSGFIRPYGVMEHVGLTVEEGTTSILTRLPQASGIGNTCINGYRGVGTGEFGRGMCTFEGPFPVRYTGVGSFGQIFGAVNGSDELSSTVTLNGFAFFGPLEPGIGLFQRAAVIRPKLSIGMDGASGVAPTSLTWNGAFAGEFYDDYFSIEAGGIRIISSGYYAVSHSTQFTPNSASEINAIVTANGRNSHVHVDDSANAGPTTVWGLSVAQYGFNNLVTVNVSSETPCDVVSTLTIWV